MAGEQTTHSAADGRREGAGRRRPAWRREERKTRAVAAYFSWLCWLTSAALLSSFFLNPSMLNEFCIFCISANS